MSKCAHKGITNHKPGTNIHAAPDGPWWCYECGAEVPNPNGCSHRRIDNATWRCTACGERMVAQKCDAVMVKSAPNALACRVPNCNGIDPRCENPNGEYYPDRSQEREVPICWEITYQCVRCIDGSDGLTITADGITGDCGRVHEGDPVPIPRETSDA